MKLGNKKAISTMVYCLFFILSLDMVIGIVGLLSGWKAVFFSCIVVLVFTVWRLFKLRYFQLEISEHIISIKYKHPFSKLFNVPVLEVPIQKVQSWKIEKGLGCCFLIIKINTRRGTKGFYYRLGSLSRKQINDFKKTLDSLKSDNDTES
jgi:hypothetical protein